MATANGILSPPLRPESANSSLSAKRKREDSLEDIQMNGAGDSKSTIPVSEIQNIIKDLVDVLKSHDDSSVLTRTLPERTPVPNEHQAKRQRPDDSEEPLTILARATSNSYNTLDEILKDIETAVSDVLTELDIPSDAYLAEVKWLPVYPAKNELSRKVSSFKKKAHELVARELAARNSAQLLDGNAKELASSIPVNTDMSNKRLVLTLYGNAPQAKQLFSSLQLAPEDSAGPSDGFPILREAGLPPGITTTQVMPIQSTGVADDKKRAKTLGELFPTPPNVRPIEPPRPSKVATTRDTKVGWYQPASADVPSRTSSYFEQKVTTGQWIDYSNASPPQNTKRKRDRAMSLGGSKAPQLEAEPIESEAAKLEALFRSAYTSFAPSTDNSAAIVPDGMVEKLWWQQIGEKNFARFVNNANDMLDATDSSVGHSAQSDEVEEFREAVEWYETRAVDTSIQACVEKSTEEKDVEEVLEGISDLLETLNSYQRIRNMSLNPPGRAAGLLSASDAGTTGTPAKPSDSEVATYEILKSQLSLMIATLPPFAVAKLDPDQLSELSISTKIPIELENYNGVMEEDEAATKAKQAVLSANSSRSSQPPAVQRTNSSSLYNTSYVPRAVPAGSHLYNTQTPARQLSNTQRPPATAPAPYPLQRPASGAAPYRSQNYGTPTYPQQGVRPVQQPYNSTQYGGGSSSGLYSGTPTQGYARPVGQAYQNTQQTTAQTPINNRYSSQPTYTQPVPAPNGAPPRYSNSGSFGRQPSPSQSGWGARQQEFDYSNRSGTYATGMPATYNSSTPSMMPNSRAYQGNTPGVTNPPAVMNGGSSQSPRPQAAQQQAPQTPQHSSGGTNYSTFMSAEQQSNLLERQRATLAAQQQGAQQQARQAAQSGALGSPAQAQVNGNTVVARS